MPLAVLAGLLIGLGFAPMGLWPATIVGVGLSTWLMASRRVGSAALHGLVMGVALNALTLHWIAVLGVPVAIGLVGIMSLWYVLLAIMLAFLTRLRGWVFWVACGWVTVETAAGSFPFGGFPWIRLGYTGLDQPLSGWFQLIGTAGITFLIAIIANLGLLAVIEPRRRLAAVSAALVPMLVGGGLLLLPESRAEQSASVGLVQGNVNRDEKGFGSYARSVTGNNLSETIILLATNRANNEEPLDFIVWPENATDIDPLSDATTGRVVELAVELADVPIMVGAVMDGPRPDTRQTSTLWWDPDTGIRARYDKRNLVPFGEWIPFRDALLPHFPVLNQIGRQSVPGEGPGVLPAPVRGFEDLHVGTIICFELAWDSTSWDTITGGAHILTSQSNTNTYAGTFEVPQQTALNRVRALETGREVIVSTLNGESGIVDAKGRMHEVTQELTTANRTFTVPLRTNITPAVVIGPWLARSLAAIGALAFLWAMLPRGRANRNDRLRTTSNDETEVTHEGLPTTGQGLGHNPHVQRGPEHREHHASAAGVGSRGPHPGGR